MELNILIKRLTGKGISKNNIPAYLRDVSNSINSGEEIDLKDLNNRLTGLGWYEFELDDHTLQLIIANLEEQDQKGKHITDVFFENQMINESSSTLSP